MVGESSRNRDLSKYITCRFDCSLRYLEALALNGFVEKVEVINCDRPKFKKIKLYLSNGKTVESGCYLDEEVSISLRIISGYMGLYRNKLFKKNSG